MALYLNEHEVSSLLDMPMIMSAVEEVMMAHARGEVVDYPRQRVRLPGSMTHMLQGGVPAANLSGFKVYTSAGGHNRFWVHLFDSNTGAAVAVLEADRLGMMRTGAAGGLATRCLARPESEVVGVFGAGWQAEGQVLALAELKTWSLIKVFARNADRVAEFCARLREVTGQNIVPAASAEETVRDSDVIVTITTSPKPLFNAEWLKEGAHITASGSNSLVRQELSEAVLRKVDLICVDARETAIREAGDLLPLLEKGRSRSGLWPELGEILCGMRPGRTHAQQITLFESQGMGVQDLAVAAKVFERAQQQGLGVALPY